MKSRETYALTISSLLQSGIPNTVAELFDPSFVICWARRRCLDGVRSSVISNDKCGNISFELRVVVD